jgi:hypothetical protein
MKVFLLHQTDLDRLLTAIDRYPQHETSGGSSQTISEQERKIYNEVHRFYNYQVRTWINNVTSDV